MTVRDRATKPLDVGSGRVAASFAPSSAAWLSVGMPHADLGFVELSALPPFDEAGRGDPTVTRAHRAAMTRAEHAWLTVEIDGAAPHLAPRLDDPAVARWIGPGVEVEAWAPHDGTAVLQRWQFHTPRDVRVLVGGRLDRPALAEITELDRPPPTRGSTSWAARPGGGADLSGPAGRVSLHLPHELSRLGDLLAGTARCAEVRIGVELAVGTPMRPHDAPSAGIGSPEPLIARSLAYIRGCTALRTDLDERVILTDHRILPLSWTRDAYWQAAALLAADGPGDRERVADHLRWLWRRCERPDGRWVRSHHANGRRKDLALQADQQMYPIIELADHWRVTGTLPEGVDWSAELERAWGVVRGSIDARTGLVPSGENAADDPAAAPFIAASQIVAWYGAMRLAELAAATGAGPDPRAVRSDAGRLRRAFDRAYAGAAWPHAIDGHGRQVAYHDANDLPVALAPLWGFVPREDPAWQGTMTFAFDAANPGWTPGVRSGLGSAHTPGPWTLGDLQRWIVARVTNRPDDLARAAARLESVAFADGMLPEAYGADDDSRIRHWFAWPGATWASLRLLDASGRLERTLAASARG